MDTIWEENENLTAVFICTQLLNKSSKKVLVAQVLKQIQKASKPEEPEKLCTYTHISLKFVISKKNLHMLCSLPRNKETLVYW